MVVYEYQVSRKIVFTICLRSFSDCKDLVRRFLEPIPEKRIRLENAARHPWLADRNCLANLSMTQNQTLHGKSDGLNEDVLLHMAEKLGMDIKEVISAVRQNR